MKINDIETNLKKIAVSYRKVSRSQQNYKTKSNMNFEKKIALIRKQNVSNKEIKQNERNEKRENIVDEDVDSRKFFKLATIDKIYVTGLHLHEIKIESLVEYTGDFELKGPMVNGPVEHKTNSIFRNRDDFNSYINAIHIEYDSWDVTFTGYD